jgi:hypothetical protein
VKGFTLPYLAYPSYRNSAYRDLGFDVSTSLGLIAAATDDSEIELIDLWTGARLTPAWGPGKVSNNRVRCLSFTSVDANGRSLDNSTHQGLLIAHGQVVEEWSC